MSMTNQCHDLASFRDYSEWTALSSDTTNLANYGYGLSAAGAITFDKANGAGNQIYAGVYKTVALDFTKAPLSHFCSEDRVVFNFYVGATTNLANLRLYLGSSLSVNRYWTILDSSMTSSTWNSLSVKLGNSGVTGAGMDCDNITYMAVAFNFDAETNELAGLVLDRVYLMRNHPTVS